MSNELILAVALSIVLVADLIIRSLRKKDKIDDSPKIGEETSKKRRFNLNYIINRKRNIIIFIILGLILKPAIHYQFFTELEEYVNTEKKLPAPEKRKDFLKLSNINQNVIRSHSNLFYTKNFDSKDDLELIRENIYYDGKIQGKIVYAIEPIVYYAKNYYLKSDEFDLKKLSFKDKIIKDNTVYVDLPHWIVKDDASNAKMVNKTGNKFLYFPRNPDNKFIEAANNNKQNGYKEKSFFYEDFNNTISFMYPIKIRDYYNNPKIIWWRTHSDGYTKDEISSRFKLFYNFEFIEKSDEPQSKSDTIEDYQKMMESGMYMDYKTKLLHDTLGNQVVPEIKGKMVNFFIHPQELRKSDFNFHFDNIFKLKLWIFLISFSFMGLLVFLFNDKIQAR